MSTSTDVVVAPDGAELFVYQWLPEGDPVGVVHIAHGMAEHAGRYARVAGALSAKGWAVYANDHRGHGRTAPSDADLGHFADEDGWNRVVEDLHLHMTRAQERHPRCKRVLIGHSMGSLIVQDYLGRHGDGLDGAVLSGTSGPPPAIATLGRFVARLERRRKGKRGQSTLIDKMAFGKFNAAFKPVRTEFDWLSRDGAEVDKYVADPHCGFLCTNELWVELLRALPLLTDSAHLARFPRDLPLYVFSGAQDPVGESGKSVKALLACYQQAGLSQVSHRLYPEGRHEMLNETNRDEVTADLLAWLDGLVG